MFRPGENWVYDLFIFFLKIWWNIIKTVLIVFFYVFQRRSPSLKPSGTITQSNSQKTKKDGVSTAVFVLVSLGLCVFGFGLSLVGNLRYSVNLLTSVLFIVAILFTGLFSVVWGFALHYRKQQRHDGLPDEIETSVGLTTGSNAYMSLVYTIRVPNSNDWQPERAQQFIEQLTFHFPQMIFSITADYEQILWQLSEVIQGAEPYVLEQIVRAVYPDAEIEVTIAEPKPVDAPFYRYICYYKQQNMWVAPLIYVDSFRQFDPVSALTQAMNGLVYGERISFVLALSGLAPDAYKQGERMITQSTIHPLQFLSRGGVGNAAGKVLSGRDRMDKFIREDQRVLEDKLRQKLCYAYLWVQVDAHEPERIRNLLAMVDSQIEHFTFMPFNTLAWIERSPETFSRLIENTELEQTHNVVSLYRRVLAGDFGKKEIVPPIMILEPREIAALWHLPSKHFSAPRISWSNGQANVPEAVVRNSNGIMLGRGKYQGRTVNVCIPHADRVTHLNIVGKTGTGKSTLMHHLIHQDIAAGHGVAVLDPHGKLVSDILRVSIPPGREKDVVVLDLNNEDFPPPLNPLIGIQDYTSTLRMVSIIDRMFEGTEESPRMSGYLRAALLPLQTETQATMRDVTRLFMDAVYRQQRLVAVDDPETQDFWD